MKRAVSTISVIFSAVLLAALIVAFALCSTPSREAHAEDKTPVVIHVTGSNVFTYRAAAVARQQMVDRPLNLPDESTLRLNVSYTNAETGVTTEANPVDAGVYDMNFSLTEVDADGFPIPGRNGEDGTSLYYTPGDIIDDRVENKLQIVIQPATLKVYADDVSMPEGGVVPELTYRIEGFLGTDTVENSLTSLPRVNAPATLEVGQHQLLPSGGSAKNYTFDYIAGTLTVNATSVVASLPGSVVNVTVSGEFVPGTQYIMNVYDKDSEQVKDLKEHIRNYRVANWTSQLEAVYYFGAAAGGDATDERTALKISLGGLTLPTDKDYFIVQVDSYGVVTKIENYQYFDGVLSFESYSADGAIMIYSAHQNEITVTFVIVAVVLILILLLIAAKVKYSNDRKDAQDRKKEKKQKLKW